MHLNKSNGLNRRSFLATSALGVSALTAGHFNARAHANPAPFLQEHGFWDYTTPGAGGMEAFQQDDYMLLLDDMEEAGMNSLMIYIKWLTTGYRSALSFQDQLPGNPVIESDNALMHNLIAEAKKRGFKIWLGGAVTYFDIEKFGSKPYRTIDMMGGFGLPIRVGLYDTDTPGLTDRIVQVCEEMVQLFPDVDGLKIELEGAGVETPHRIPKYNEWAEENGRPSFDQMQRPLDPRNFDVPDWRDYTTYSRLKVLKEIERAVRKKGFKGTLGTIYETGNSRYAVFQEVNVELAQKEIPDWVATTYEYYKDRNRYAMMDLCINQPKLEGVTVYYLPRGVMTWGGSWPLEIALERSWEMDVEDILQFQPHGVWWFGCGTANEGAHVSLERLKAAGYESGTEARRALLQRAKALRVG